MQLQAAATSAASNYRACCRAQTRPGFVAKLSIALEEADEAVGWLECRIFDGMADLLAELSVSGRTLALATSKFESTARRMLEHFGLAGHFTVIAGASADGTRRSKAQVIARALDVPEIRILTTPENNLSAERGQWNDACNVLTQRPNVVYAYDRNTVANEYLESEGVKVITVPGAELGRGRGGPRCMSCPTVREDI